jgi:hypothetical protein
LEKGVFVYSAEEKEMVVVTDPLNFILADNPAHSDICGIIGLTTSHLCRKCYFMNKKKRNQDYDVSVEQHSIF